jgi:hypothetical protein
MRHKLTKAKAEAAKAKHKAELVCEFYSGFADVGILSNHLAGRVMVGDGDWVRPNDDDIRLEG